MAENKVGEMVVSNTAACDVTFNVTPRIAEPKFGEPAQVATPKIIVFPARGIGVKVDAEDAERLKKNPLFVKLVDQGTLMVGKTPGMSDATILTSNPKPPADLLGPDRKAGEAIRKGQALGPRVRGLGDGDVKVHDFQTV
jgi:hypothetical protein